MDGEDSQQGGPDTSAARHTEVCAKACAEGSDILVDAQLLGQLVDVDRDGADAALRGKGDGSGRPDALEELDGAEVTDKLDECALDHEDLNRAENIGQNQNAQQGNEVCRRRTTDRTGDQSQNSVRSIGNDVADDTAHDEVACVDEFLEGCNLFGFFCSDLIVADGDEDREHDDGNDLAVDPMGSQIAGEQVDDGVHDGGNFFCGVVGRQLILDAVADFGDDTSNEGDDTCEEGVQHEEEDGLQTDVFEPHRVAEVGDAGNDAEDQQGNDDRRDDVSVNGADGRNIGVMTLEDQTHDQAETNGQNGADTKIDMLFLVQIV